MQSSARLQCFRFGRSAWQEAPTGSLPGKRTFGESPGPRRNTCFTKGDCRLQRAASSGLGEILPQPSFPNENRSTTKKKKKKKKTDKQRSLEGHQCERRYAADSRWLFQNLGKILRNYILKKIRILYVGFKMTLRKHNLK